MKTVLQRRAEALEKKERDACGGSQLIYDAWRSTRSKSPCRAFAEGFVAGRKSEQELATPKTPTGDLPDGVERDEHGTLWSTCPDCGNIQEDLGQDNDICNQCDYNEMPTSGER